MAMGKKDFIALADTIKYYNAGFVKGSSPVFDNNQIEALAQFCKSQNPSFMTDRWIGYINGDNGPNGGSR